MVFRFILAPPKQITVTSRLTGFSYHVVIDGHTMRMTFNYFEVCNLNTGLRHRKLVRKIKLAANDYETCEIVVMCPPKRTVDDQRKYI
jgi:hypothetical protein